MIRLPRPDEIRKAAAFIEAIARIEADFGYLLDLGIEEDVAGYPDRAVTFGPKSPEAQRFVIFRNSTAPGDLALGVEEA